MTPCSCAGNRLAALAVVLASAGSVNAHGPARVPGFVSTVIEELPASVQEAPERGHSIFA